MSNTSYVDAVEDIVENSTIETITKTDNSPDKPRAANETPHPVIQPLHHSNNTASQRKLYILDTNVLLHDPNALLAFNEHHVVIPMTVLEELDAIKDRRDKDVSREARIAINAIDDIVENASPIELQAGVFMPGQVEQQGMLSIFADQMIEHTSVDALLNNEAHYYNDDRIINVALYLQDEYPERCVCLVTKDINMRLKAKGSGLEHVEDYRKDKVVEDIQFMAKGNQHFSGNFWASVDNVETNQSRSGRVVHSLDRKYLPDPYNNLLVYDDEGFCGLVKHYDDQQVSLEHLDHDHLMHQDIWGIKPRNFEQAMAFYQIQRDDIDMMVMTGPAGSGKTLIALAYGLQATLEEKLYDKIIVARSTPPIAEDIGFLPGTEEEKMAPWLAAFDDNLEVLHANDECAKSSIDYIKEKANIQFKSLNFMRGRSFNNAYVIIDEAQGLTQFQLKSIITRVGNNSKIVVLGNLAQIDNKYISPLTSGLTYLVEKSKDFPHAAIMHVNGVERSRLAAFAEEAL